MFELPELVCFSRQMNQSLRGLVVREGTLGNSPHKFVWYNRSHAEFSELTAGKTAGEAYVRGRWLFLPLEPGYVLVVGECGGKMPVHEPEPVEEEAAPLTETVDETKAETAEVVDTPAETEKTETKA